MREGEGYLCGTAAQRRAVWLLSRSDKIPPYSGRCSLGRETRPGGQRGSAARRESNNVMCKTEEVHADRDVERLCCMCYAVMNVTRYFCVREKQEMLVVLI